jgi:hypothetical protein
MDGPVAPVDAFAPGARPGALLRGLVGWLAAAILAGVVLAPPAFWLVDAMAPGRFPFDRVFRRVVLLAAVVYLVIWCRRIGVRRFADVGLGRPAWRTGAALRGALAGALVVVAAFGVEFALGRRLFQGSLSPLALAEILAGGALVGWLEEAICRGALLFPFGRLRGAGLIAASTAVSAVYSTAHFARGGRGAVAVVGWDSGLELWSRVPPAVAGYFESWLGLFAIGLLFDRVARRQGHAWGVVGLHAGAVVAIQLGAALTAGTHGDRSSLFFVDGLLPGWGLTVPVVLTWLALGAWSGRGLSGGVATDGA